mgnify:CR=1 FL=1
MTRCHAGWGVGVPQRWDTMARPLLAVVCRTPARRSTADGAAFRGCLFVYREEGAFFVSGVAGFPVVVGTEAFERFFCGAWVSAQQTV